MAAVRECAVMGCGRPVRGRGWCQAHYMRWWYTGDVRPNEPVGSHPRGTPMERLCAQTRREDDCLLWTGTIGGDGYGTLMIDGRNIKAHRLAYELFVGPIPKGLVLDHLCRVRRCVDPNHLEPVTSAENTRRAARLITHCPAGHPYDDKNTRVTPDGGRICRACHCARERAAYRRRQEVSREVKARQAVYVALRAGQITRPDHCGRCGVSCIPDGHHESYEPEHWLEVVWLCRACHGATHRKVA